jgi:shikimate dehydrogenase
MTPRHCGLTGKPVSHSLSPAVFREIFRRYNITDASYALYPLAEVEELLTLVRRDAQLFGLNVTIPFKEKVLGLMDILDTEAAEIGAVNCIRIERAGGKVTLEGFNTDSRAFRETISPHLGKRHRRALVLGTGGAAKAVVHALKNLDISHRTVSREPESDGLAYKDLEGLNLGEYPVIINATPLGMHPDVETCPDIPYEKLSAEHLLYDLVYQPEKTLFMTKGESYGAKTLSGRQMLWRQAELSWLIWNENKSQG